MLRKLTISAALVGILGAAALLAPASSTTGALSAAPTDATQIEAPVFSNVVVNNNNG
jgi:hypothetical protein